jgi:hypothetical protein
VRLVTTTRLAPSRGAIYALVLFFSSLLHFLPRRTLIDPGRHCSGWLVWWSAAALPDGRGSVCPSLCLAPGRVTTGAHTYLLVPQAEPSPFPPFSSSHVCLGAHHLCFSPRAVVVLLFPTHLLLPCIPNSHSFVSTLTALFPLMSSTFAPHSTASKPACPGTRNANTTHTKSPPEPCRPTPRTGG